MTTALAIIAAGCQRDDMWNQPRGETLGASTFFSDGSMAREPVEGTVARGKLRDDEHLYLGTENGQPAETFPFEITRAVMERGMERYNIFCAPCHGKTGDGMGMIVQRGYMQPEAFYVQRLRDASPGYIYDVIVNGTAMVPPEGMLVVGEGDLVHPPMAKRIPFEDRWAIVAYIRALQRSQRATIDDVPPEERPNLDKPHGRDAGATGGGH